MLVRIGTLLTSTEASGETGPIGTAIDEMLWDDGDVIAWDDGDLLAWD